MSASMGESLGAAYLGVVVSSFLFGITTLQVYIYYQHYSGDKLQNRIVVPLLWIMDAFHLALAIHAVYFYLVNQLPFIYIIWSMRVQLSFVVLIAITVTSLYAVRIWNLAYHPRRCLVCFLLIAQLLELTAGFFEVYACFAVHSYLQIDHFLWQIQFALASHAAVDCFLAGAMCYYLQIGRTSFSSIDSTIVKLMRYIVCSGVATGACAIVTLIAIATAPTSQIWVAFYYLLSKLYVNSFLALLNARRSIRREMDEPSSLAALSEVRFAGADIDAQTPFQSTTSCHSDDAKPCYSLVTLNGIPSREGLAKGHKFGTSTSLTV